jgi:hypothetical protein
VSSGGRRRNIIDGPRALGPERLGGVALALHDVELPVDVGSPPSFPYTCMTSSRARARHNGRSPIPLPAGANALKSGSFCLSVSINYCESCRQERMMSNSDDAAARAAASVKRKQQQVQESAKAWSEYQAQRRAVAEKTERLRLLRLAKEAAEKAGNGKRVAARPSRTKSSGTDK